MFGCSPRLPVDLAFGLPLSGKKHQSHSQYVQNLKSRLKESYDIASKNAAKASEKNKVRFDQRVIPSKLEPGDRVLVRSVRMRGKHKLSDKWKQDIYVVVDQAGDLPVYTVKPECRDGPKRTLHRDFFLPCGFLPAVEEPSIEASPVSRPRTRQQRETTPDSEVSEEEDSSPEPTVLSLDPNPMKFYKRASSPSVANDYLPPSMTSVSEPAVVDEGSESEHLPEEEMLPVTPDHLPEAEESVVPVETDLSEHPLQSELEEEESVDLETSVPSVSEPLHFDLTLDSVEPEPSPRRSVRQRLLPERLQYSSLGNPLISVVQSLLHNISDALKPTSTTSSVIHVV